MDNYIYFQHLSRIHKAKSHMFINRNINKKILEMILLFFHTLRTNQNLF